MGQNTGYPIMWSNAELTTARMGSVPSLFSARNRLCPTQVVTQSNCVSEKDILNQQAITERWHSALWEERGDSSRRLSRLGCRHCY